FRLIRRRVFDRVQLEFTSGVICVELIKKIEDAGFKIIEVPVSHYPRLHGRSQFFTFGRVFQTGRDLLRLWLKLARTHRAELQASASPLEPVTRSLRERAE